MNITNKYGPNTTLLLPGSCNASCGFCFWNREEAHIRPPSDYLDKVVNILSNLPEEFKVLSISGGEPTLSPWFGRVLSILGRYRRDNRLDRVVLTTHGGNLIPFITAIGCVVDHINISRHGIGVAANREIFKTDKIPTDVELIEIIHKIHNETACDITLNCVIENDATISFCQDFIEYAKILGADAVSFRKVASDTSPTVVETYFVDKYGIVSETKCPVCRGLEQRVNDFTVRWKGSVLEPSLQTGGVYEAVIHPDGKVYSDWGMRIPLKLGVVKKPRVTTPPQQIVYVTRSSGGGCGSSGC